MPSPGASVSSLRHSADRLLVAFACLKERVRMVAFNGVRANFATIVDGFDIHFSQELRMKSMQEEAPSLRSSGKLTRRLRLRTRDQCEFKSTQNVR